MANVMRYRYGDTNPVSAAVDSAVVIEIGDLVALVSGKAVPADDFADAGTKAQNQEAFHDLFLGVAEQQSRAGDTDPIRVATSGTFELDIASATLGLGALVGAAGTGEAGAVGVANQIVESVATPNLAIGRVQEAIASKTKVKVNIDSVIMTGGPRAMA
jgi:hypothetical protein